MADIVTIELGFRQQVAAEALKNPPKLSFRWRSRDSSVGVGLSYCDGNQILASKESRDNGYVKCKAVDHPNRHQYLRCSRSQIIRSHKTVNKQQRVRPRLAAPLHRIDPEFVFVRP